MNKKDIIRVKQMVQLLERTAGRKIKFVEKKPLKESAEPALNGIVDSLQKLSSRVDGLGSNNISVQGKQMVLTTISEIIQMASESDTIAEDVSMTIDQAEKDPDAIKKFGDKDIDVKLTDEDGDDKSAVII